MSNISTFGTYTTARLGIFAAQRAMNVVGNNISNVNTEGYTRQSLDQIALNFGGSDRQVTAYDLRIGSGALATAVVQSRDAYLDARYRDEMTSVGAMEGKLDGLQQLGSVLDEVGLGEDGSGILEARFNEMIEQMEELHARGAGKDEYDSMFRTTASTTVETINSIARKLNTIQENEDRTFRGDLDETNSLLVRIRDLNSAIRDIEVFGGNALEQKDERNLLIDQLSEYTRIAVSYEKEKLGEGVVLDHLVIKTMGYPQRTLVEGDYCTQLSIRTVTADKDSGEPLDALSGDEVKDLVKLSQLLDADLNLSGDDSLYTKLQDNLKDVKNKTDKVAQSIYPSDGATSSLDFYLNSLIPPKDDNGSFNSSYMDLDDEAKAQYAAKLTNLLNEVAKVETIEIEDPYYRLSTEELKDADGRKKELEVVSDIAQDVQPSNGYSLSGVSDPDSATRYSNRTAAEQIVDLLNGNPRYTDVEQSDGTSEKMYTYSIRGSLGSGYHIERYNEADGTHDFLLIKGKGYTATDTEGENASGTTTARTFPDAEEASRIAKVLNAELDFPSDIDEKGREVQIEFRVVKNDSGSYEIHRIEVFRGETNPGETELYGKLQSERELLTKQGVFSTEKQLGMDSEASNKRGIPFYRKALDVLANTFATVMNKTNTDAGGQVLFSNDSTKDTDGTGTNGGPKIDASNISISNSWANGSHKVQIENNTLGNKGLSTGNDNLINFLNRLTGEHEFYPQGGIGGEGGINQNAKSTEVFFTGSFQELFTNHMGGSLANDTRATQAMLDNYSTTAEDLYVDRDAVMGVDLNDEAMNLMMYEKSYAAACRLMTTFDSMLDRLINGTAM